MSGLHYMTALTVLYVTPVNHLPESQTDATIKQLGDLVPATIRYSRPCLLAKRPADTEWLEIA